MKTIISSLGTIVFVAAVVAGGTGAFFSDTETSTGNVFTAGAIDLTVDSEAHYNGSVCLPNLQTTDPTDYTWQGGNEYPVGLACSGTWAATDLGAKTFFSYADVKPGDEGENTISLHVDNNPAWACVDVTLTKNDDVSSNEPELGAGDVAEDAGNVMDGELAQNMKFAAWLDQGATAGWQGKGVDVGEGDNKWDGDTKEPLLFSNQSGPASDVLGGKSYALADSTTGTGPMQPLVTNYIGLAWCAGTQVVNTTSDTITCDGAGMGNIAQTDSMEATIAFRVEQHRNNEQFTCAPRQTPITWVENGVQAEGDASIVGDQTAPAGSNVLRLSTIDDVNSRVRYSYDTPDIDLSAFTGFSYDSKQVSANDLVNGNASFRLVVDLNGDMSVVKDVTYEPYYNIFAHNDLNSPAILSNIWQTWAATMTKGKFWASGVTTAAGVSGGGGAYATNFTIQQLSAAYPNAKILGISIGMGTYNVNQVVHVDNLVFNGSNLGFE